MCVYIYIYLKNSCGYDLIYSCRAPNRKVAVYEGHIKSCGIRYFGQIEIYINFYMAIFGHIKYLFSLSPVMKRSIKPMHSLPTQKHFLVKFECQIKKWKYLFENHILPYQPNTLHAQPILLSCYSHNVFTSACCV